MTLKTINQANVTNKRVLVRLDINAAVVKGKILDNPRFSEQAKTIKELLEKNAKIIIIAHQGRPNSADFITLAQHAVLLSKHVGKEISYVSDLFEEQAKKRIASLNSGQAILLKNLRAFEDEFHPEKEDNKLIGLFKACDLYINDAFSASHRLHASIVLPPRYLPSYIGRSFERELQALEHFPQSKKTTFIIGGSKIEDYLPLFTTLKNKEHTLLAAGVLGNLGLIAKGYDLGYENQWAAEQNYIQYIPQLKQFLQDYPKQIILPLDFAIGDVKRKEISLQKVPFEQKIWDIGKKTVALFKQHLDTSENIFMKGPVGFSERKQFSYGTVELLKHIAQVTEKKKVFSLLGGGHLTTTIQNYNLPTTFSYISLAGGALLQYFTGEPLPGIVALQESPHN